MSYKRDQSVHEFSADLFFSPLGEESAKISHGQRRWKNSKNSNLSACLLSGTSEDVPQRKPLSQLITS